MAIILYFDKVIWECLGGAFFPDTVYIFCWVGQTPAHDKHINNTHERYLLTNDSFTLCNYTKNHSAL